MANYVLTSKAVRKLTAVLDGRHGDTGAGNSAAYAHDREFPAPYTVQWSASADSGTGAWVIWLGDAAHVLFVGGAYRAIGGVAAESALPTGWYRLTNLASASTAVWLNVATDASTGAFAYATLADAAESGSTGYDVAAYHIAALVTVAATGERRVRQSVTSSILAAVGGGGGGGTSGYTGTQDVPYGFDGPRSDGKLYALTKTWTFANGLLQSVTTGPDVVVADTVEHSGL